MSLIGNERRYGVIAQSFHWLTALLVLAAFMLAEGGPPSRVYGEANAAMLQLHESLGVLVFILVAARLVWRFFDRRPVEPPMPGWMSLASRAAHFGLYALLFLVPATAIFGAWLSGHPVTVYGLGAIGPFTITSSLGRSLAGIHGTLGDALMWLAGLHAAAAIFHHVFLKDRVLRQMLPVG
jgi:cytochrome b561